MSAAVEAAIIAGSVGLLTLIGTLAAQFYGIRRTGKDTLNARFATAVDKLGSEAPAVRLAGVYAIAGLADDWPENQQICVDVLCGYLRMPYEPDPGEEAPEPDRLAFQANREVRHTVIRVITAHLKHDAAKSRQVRHTVIRLITAHLKHDAAKSWRGLNFDFTGVRFDGGDFADANFPSGEVSFRNATFASGEVSFLGATFSGGMVSFRGATFSGATIRFGSATFSGGEVNFRNATFSGSEVYFSSATFCGGAVYFGGTKLSGGTVYFGGAEFCGGTVDFRGLGDWSVPLKFPWKDTPPPGVKL